MRRKIIPYNPILKLRARHLRNNSTKAEIILWNQLKQKKMHGMDFDRQRPILNYIVDFYCKDLQLAIEVDGGIHDHQVDYDRKRQFQLEEVGVRFLRFENEDIYDDMDNVLLIIEEWIINEMKDKNWFLLKLSNAHNSGLK